MGAPVFSSSVRPREAAARPTDSFFADRAPSDPIEPEPLPPAPIPTSLPLENEA